MSERERASGECECGNIIYGFGVACECCQRSADADRLERLNIYREDQR